MCNQKSQKQLFCPRRRKGQAVGMAVCLNGLLYFCNFFVILHYCPYLFYYQAITCSVCSLQSYTAISQSKTTCFTFLEGLFSSRKRLLYDSKTSCFTLWRYISSTLKAEPLLLRLRSYPIFVSLFPSSTSVPFIIVKVGNIFSSRFIMSWRDTNSASSEVFSGDR